MIVAMPDALQPANHHPIEQLLARPLSDAVLDRNTETVARLPPTALRAGETLIFFVRWGEILALPAANALRAFPPQPIHRVPHRPGPIFRGIASERGELRLVGSLEATLDLMPPTMARAASTRRMLLVDWEGDAWLVEVDAVIGVHRSRRETWMSPPSTVSQGRRKLTTHVVPLGMRRAALLDPARLVALFREAIA